MPAANDKIAYAESAARPYSDLDSARRRLIELEKTRLFSDEDLALLIRKGAQSNLKEGFEARTLNRRARASSNRTTGGRAVIRSWAPAELEESAVSEHSDESTSNGDGWKEFVEASRPKRGPIKEPVQRVEPAFEGARLKRPSRLKRMQNRNFIVALLANIIFVPKKAVWSLVGMVVPSVGRRAC